MSNANGRWQQRYQQWLEYVKQTEKLLDGGSAIPIGPTEPPFKNPESTSVPSRGPVVLLASPHPDDEGLIGALPLRLRYESGARVVNCAITLGSDRPMRLRRGPELQHACKVLGFELVIPQEEGFSRVTVENRSKGRDEWAAKVEALSNVFDEQKPDAVFAPHADDFNTAHIGTHYVVRDALGEHLERSGRGPVAFIETEFWHEHHAPNLMIGVSAETVALQVMATAEHGGEVSRNPYHVRLPARMIDNVRRGSEVVGGQGVASQPYSFAELYRVTFMKGREHVQPKPGGMMIGPDQKTALDSILYVFRPDSL